MRAFAVVVDGRSPDSPTSRNESGCSDSRPPCTKVHSSTGASQSRPQVLLCGFGKESLEFECVYIVKDPGYNLYVDIQQAINFHLLERFSKVGAKFAVPVRAIMVTALPQEDNLSAPGREGLEIRGA